MSNLIAPPFGRDLSARKYIDATRVVDGATLLAEACFRRLSTPRGSLEYDPNYGLSLSRLLNGEVTDDRIAAFPALVHGELTKDPRIADVRTTLVVDRTNAPSVSVEMSIEGIAKDGTEFALAVRVTDLTIELLSVGASNG